MNIEWPEGAEWYVQPRENNSGQRPFFARTCASSKSGGKMGVKVSGGEYHVLETYWEITRRPAAEWIPKVGGTARTSVGMCEVIAVDSLGGKAAVRHTDSGALAVLPFSGVFQPAPSLRDKLITAATRAMGNAYVDGPGGVTILSDDTSFYAAAVVDAVLESFEVKENEA